MLQTQVRSDLPEGAAGIEPRPYKRILVAYEASASSNLALRTGRELSLLSKRICLSRRFSVCPPQIRRRLSKLS